MHFEHFHVIVLTVGSLCILRRCTFFSDYMLRIKRYGVDCSPYARECVHVLGDFSGRGGESRQNTR